MMWAMQAALYVNTFLRHLAQWVAGADMHIEDDMIMLLVHSLPALISLTKPRCWAQKRGWRQAINDKKHLAHNMKRWWFTFCLHIVLPRAAVFSRRSVTPIHGWPSLHVVGMDGSHSGLQFILISFSHFVLPASPGAYGAFGVGDVHSILLIHSKAAHVFRLSFRPRMPGTS